MVQCKNCGFLAVRDEYDETVHECTSFTLERAMHKSSKGNSTAAKIFCWKDARQFDANDLATYGAIHDAMRVEIDCRDFMKRLPGRSPKEYEEMSIVERVQSIQDAYNRKTLSAVWVAGISAAVAAIMAIGSLIVSIIALKH
jgi:hypothetical protein